MANRTSKDKTDPADAMAQMTDWQKAAMAPMAGLAPAWTEAVQDYMRMSGEFLARRVEKDMQLQRELLGCRDPKQWQELQAHFMEEAMEDYRAQSGQMAEIGRRFVDAATNAQKS